MQMNDECKTRKLVVFFSSSSYLLVFLVGLLRDLLGLSQLVLEHADAVVLHVGLVLEGLAYPG